MSDPTIYPDSDTINYFAEYANIKETPTISGFKLQKYQKFARNFINVNTPFNNLFVFHGTGAGKTLLATLIAEEYKNFLLRNTDIEGYIYIIGSYASQENFVKEIIGRGGNIANQIPPEEDNPYISNQERRELEELEKLVRVQRDKYIFQFNRMHKRYIRNRLKVAGYRFMSYQKFRTDSPKNINNSLIIIDEMHSLLNKNEFAKALMNLVDVSHNYKLVGLSATPMFNEPKDIVDFFNLMFKEKDRLKYEDIFIRENELREGGLEFLQKKVKGIVSHIRGLNPKTFPERIEHGTKPPGLKYTNVVRVPMSKLQYKAYVEKEERGTIKYDLKHDIRYITNFVIPGPDGEPLYKKLEMELLTAPKDYLQKMGIEVRKVRNDVIITGDFLKEENLIKWSPKYLKCLQNINNEEGHIFIFNTFVHNVGIKLFAEILHVNGYDPYGDAPNENSRHYLSGEKYSEWMKKNPDKPFKSAKYFVYHKDVSPDERARILRVFNSKANIDGAEIKIILGSQLTRETIDLKRVRYIHILNYQENFSRLEQIIGRGIRYMSHSDVPVKRVEVFKYVSSMPEYKSLSAEELEYLDDESKYITIKKIERALKMAAVDCQFNREFNIFPEEFEKYKNTIICDYTECNYKCINDYIPEEKIDFMYKLFYQDFEVYDAIEYIKVLFKTHPVLDFITITEMIQMDLDIIKLALNRIIEEQIVIRHGSIPGYLIKIENNYLFQPRSIDDISIGINLRISGSNVERKRTINNEIFQVIQENRSKKKISIDGIYAQLKELENNFGMYGVTISKLTHEYKLALIEKAIIDYYVAYNEKKKLNTISFNVLRYFKRYLIDEKQLERDPDFNHSNYDLYFRSISFDKPSTDKLFVGHYLGYKPRMLDKKTMTFYEIDPSEIISQRKMRVSAKENPYIIGYIDKNSKGELVFKLRYTGELQDVTDQRRQQRGFVCSQVNDKAKLLSIMKALDIKINKRKKAEYKTSDLCDLIEADLREKQAYSNKNNLGIRWFYDYIHPANIL